MAAGTPESRSAQWREVSAEAREVLAIALRWNLAAPGWRQAQVALEGMQAAVAAADPESLWRAIVELEQLGPSRVAARLGDDSGTPPREPAPEIIRERVNILIDALLPHADHGTPTG